MKFGVVVFPGSNCDHDAYHVVSKHLGQPVDFIWHKETDLSGYDAILIPGGFSYGDYLRAGALASFSPVMNAVKDFAAKGKFVFGTATDSNSCETGLLLEACAESAHFVCRPVNIRTEKRALLPERTEKECLQYRRSCRRNYFCDDGR